MKPINKNNFHTMCKDIKNYVEKNYDLPTKLTYGGIDYYQIEMAYCMAYGLHHLKSDFNIPNFGKWRNLKGEAIHTNVKLNEIMEQGKRVYNHILNNAEAPSSVLVKADKHYLISTKVWIYSIAKTIVYYDTNKQLPLQTLYRSDAFNKPAPKPTVRKYGHATEPCCDDMGQNTPYYCACHSLQEVFRNLTGIVVPQSTIAPVCGTTTSGTGHGGMNTCVEWFNRKYGKNLKTEWKHFSELGWNGLKDIINSNNKDCIIHNLYRNSDGHYEVINNVGSDINVQNSLGSRCSRGCYNGYIEYRSRSEFQSYINGISQKSVMVITNAG